MFTKMATTTGLSTSMRSVRNPTEKTSATLSRPGASLTKYGQAEVLSRPSSSQLADAYKTEEFLNEWANDVQFHVARNVLNLRRYRRMSQASVARAVGTSQSAIARIESGQENITMDTLRRLVVALKGRLHVSIPPQECARNHGRPWWEANEPAVNTWNLVGWAARQGHQTDQLILGLERPCERDLSGSTLPLKAGMLLEPASTGSRI
jgi:transcriptional regulator with XRE-family HTH domain